MALLGLKTASVSLAGQPATITACVALLVFGLPHGSLDIATLAEVRLRSTRWLGSVVALYLGCAAAMYLIWNVAPLAALTLFLIMAALHFAEDWQNELPPFLAIGTAIAVLTAPTFLYSAPLSDVFIGLTGSEASAALAGIGLMIAPVALAVAVAGAFMIESQASATETLVVLAAMILLPPIVGFALYFGLSHSPRHLASAVRSADRGLFGYRRIEMIVVTLAAVAIATMIFIDVKSPTLSDGAIAASFITLSILTVPHMLVPVIVAAFERRQGLDTAQ
jgi:beta-carotene 15,15'-dioxygenase